MIKRSGSSLSIGIMVLCLIAVFWLHERHQGIECSDPLKESLARTKQLYKFSDWGGSAKIPDKRIRTLGLTEDDFSKYGKIRIFTSEERRNRKLSFEIPGNKLKNGVNVSINLYDSALAAQNEIMREVNLCVVGPPPNHERAKKGTTMDIGDVCLFPNYEKPPTGVRQEDDRPFITHLYFTRNNAFVEIMIGNRQDKESLDIIELAKFIDKKLIEMLD